MSTVPTLVLTVLFSKLPTLVQFYSYTVYSTSTIFTNVGPNVAWYYVTPSRLGLAPRSADAHLGSPEFTGQRGDCAHWCGWRANQHHGGHGVGEPYGTWVSLLALMLQREGEGDGEGR